MSDISAVPHRKPTRLNRRTAAAVAAVRRRMAQEAMGGLILLTAAIAALILANSPLHDLYQSFIHLPIHFSAGSFSFGIDMHFLVNEVLMTVFFLLVGVEIRQEMHNGALSNLRQAGLPLIAACGGVCMPALIYLSLNLHGGAPHGWAVPTATDIAFAVGILALLGSAVPANLRIVLLSLAVIDDIIAVLIIAFFYSDGLSLAGAGIAALGAIIVLALQYLGFRSLLLYCLAGALLWFGLWRMGVHPSLAGVVLGMLTPVLPLYDDAAAKAPGKAEPAALPLPPTRRVAQAVHFWVAFGVMPLFAFANAGVRLADISFAQAGSAAVALGISGGLIFGKPIGVLLASFIAVRIGLCRLPPQVTWPGMVLVGLLAGIGFTMAIFVGHLAYHGGPETSVATLAILCGSAISAVLGLIYGVIYCRRLKSAAAMGQKR